jgi:hypothetical protein
MITEADFIEIFERYGLSREIAVSGYETYKSSFIEVGGRPGPGPDDEAAKRDIELIAAAMAAPRINVDPPKKRGFFARLLGR